MNTIQRRLLVALWACALAGCAVRSHTPRAPPTRQELQTQLPLQRAWVDGRQVDYVTTDVSDAAMAEAMGVNYVPRLADALPTHGVSPGLRRAPVERVYMFPGREQINVFPSAPRPAGPANADAAYSPLWRVVLVRWLRHAALREIDSEERLLAAQERGDIALELTGIVVNCPVIRSADGRALRDVP